MSFSEMWALRNWQPKLPSEQSYHSFVVVMQSSLTKWLDTQLKMFRQKPGHGVCWRPRVNLCLASKGRFPTEWWQPLLNALNPSESCLKYFSQEFGELLKVTGRRSVNRASTWPLLTMFSPQVQQNNAGSQSIPILIQLLDYFYRFLFGCLVKKQQHQTY